MSNPVVTATSGLNSAWEGLGATSKFQPPTLDRSCFVHLGDVFSGKTTLHASRKNCLILSVEPGADSIPNMAATRIAIPTYGALEKAKSLLMSEAKSARPTFSHVVFDTVDRMQSLVMEQLASEVGKDITEYRGGKGGWWMLTRRMLSFFRDLQSVGYGWTALMHLKEYTDETTGATLYKPAVTGTLAAGLYADKNFLMGSERDSEKVNVQVQVDPARPGVKRTEQRDRYRYWLLFQNKRNSQFNFQLGSRIPMPDKIELTDRQVDGWSLVEKAYNESIAQLTTPKEAPSSTT